MGIQRILFSINSSSNWKYSIPSRFKNSEGYVSVNYSKTAFITNNFMHSIFVKIQLPLFLIILGLIPFLISFHFWPATATAHSCTCKLAKLQMIFTSFIDLIDKISFTYIIATANQFADHRFWSLT